MSAEIQHDARVSADALLQRCATGDEGAFRTLYDTEAPRLKAVALRITRSATVAEDVLHDVFLQVWHDADRFDPRRGPARAWLTSLVRFRSMELVRRSGREMTGLGLPDALDDAPDALAQLLSSADGRALHHCLERLEPLRQTLIRRAFVEGLSHVALAQETGLALGTVKSLIRRSLLLLKHCLDTEGRP